MTASSNQIVAGGGVQLYTDPLTGVSKLAGATVCANSCLLVGDSITANSNGSGSNYGYTQNIGCFTWANAFMNQKLSVIANVGVSGMRVTGTGGMAESIAANMALYRPDYVAFLGGTNDITNGVTYADLIAGYGTIIRAVVSTGAVVLMSTILPRAVSGYTANQAKTLMQVNAWIREVATRWQGVIVSDPFRALADPTNSTSDPLAVDCYDGILHPGPSGAMKVGEKWAADWGPFINTSARQFCGAGDVYDSTNNVYGNMVSNGLLQTLGATSGTGFAGNNPTGYTVQRIAGAGTWTGSAVARTDLIGNQGNWYRAAITAESSASAQYELRQNVSGPNSGSGTTYAIGDSLFAEAELKITHTGSTNYVKAVHLIATEYDRSGSTVWVSRAVAQYTGSVTGGGSALQRTKDYQVTVRTPTFTSIGSTGSGSDVSQRITLAVNVIYDGSVQAALTVDFGHMSLRKAIA